MNKQQVIALLLASSSATQQQSKDQQSAHPWTQLEHCPDFDERFTLVDGRTRAVPYPRKGFNCNPEWSMAQNQENKQSHPWSTLEHCPDFDERFTLVDGRTRAVPYPRKGYNCNPEWSMAQNQENKQSHPWSTLEHCPDFDERFTLVDGRTRAVPYPRKGYNCNPEWSMAQNQENQQSHPWATLEHCPDFDERFTLVDGRTRAVPYPRKGYNCNPEWSLAQGGPYVQKAPKELENCPQPLQGTHENYYLNDQYTLAKPYPLPGYNCYVVPSPSYAQVNKAPEGSHVYHYSPIKSLETCPDYTQTVYLKDQQTHAVPFPAPGYNCYKWQNLAQQAPEGAHVYYYKPINSLEACPDFANHPYLKDDHTVAKPFPEPGYNCYQFKH